MAWAGCRADEAVTPARTGKGRDGAGRYVSITDNHQGARHGPDEFSDAIVIPITLTIPLAVFDYKTIADPDVTPGDMLSIWERRTRQIREALTLPETPIDPSIPIVGMRVFVPPE